jgi:integrase
MASIRRRKNRKAKPWVVDAFDATGQRRRVAARTREEAETIRAKLVQEAQQAAPVIEDRDITLDVYADRWLEQIASSVEPRTAASYSATLRLHIRPVFGKMPLRVLHRGHIKALLARKRAQGLSKNSVRLIRATLSVMLSDAMDDMIIAANAALGINRKGRKTPDSMSLADRKKNIKAMTYEQLATFLAVSAARCSRRSALYFLLMADAGLRPGEACALQWPDFDLVGQNLQVERAVTDSGRIKGVKTGEAREVDLTPRLVAALAGFQAEMEAEALVAGKDRIAPWVFATRAGTPPRPHRVAKTFKKVLKAAGLPHFRLYDLRHTYASHLIAQRADIAYVARQLGHAKMTTTLLFYSHWFPKGDRLYLEEMERVRSFARLLDVPAVPDDAAIPADQEALNDDSWHHFGTTSESSAPEASEALDFIGGPWRTRTSDPLIKSQLLYQLS